MKYKVGDIVTVTETVNEVEDRSESYFIDLTNTIGLTGVVSETFTGREDSYNVEFRNPCWACWCYTNEELRLATDKEVRERFIEMHGVKEPANEET